jgi:gentisate 1,2-dioxygenase
VEGSGAYTAVDGERTTMRPGDFIITPSWTFHDHGNPGNEPVVWMDGLDVRIVATFAAQFHEVYPQEVQPVARSEGAATARFGSGLVPLDTKPPFGKTSPIFNYPYDRSREALEGMSRDQDPDPCHGWKMQFTNPLTGGHAMPTIAAFVQLLPKGMRTKAYRCTDGTIFSVVEGGGSAKIGAERFDFEPRDTFVVPSWAPLEIEARDQTVLFSFSDRPGQEAMGLWREKRG